MIILLNDHEFKKCKEFSIKSAKDQQRIEFGQSDTQQRTVNEIAKDNFIGKSAEIAFAKMIKEKFEYHIDLDFNYYPRGAWDKEDCIINGWKIDIKSSKAGKWLLIEFNKIEFRVKHNELPHLFIFAVNEWKDNKPTNKVQLMGIAFLKHLRKDKEHTLILKKGDLIPNTNTRLQADNFAIHSDHLFKKWDEIIEYILSNKPPDISDYEKIFQEVNYGHHL